MKNFLLLLQNQKLFFSFKFPFNLAAEPPTDPVGDEAETLTYPKVWTILKLARTIFAPRSPYSKFASQIWRPHFARGGGEKAQKI